MLVVTRNATNGRRGSKLTIGDDVTVTVIKIDRNTVKLGIDAPADVKILRDDAKRREP